MMKIGVLASSVVKKVLDTFTRTTSGSLGTSDSGAAWSALKGTWYANGSQAQSDDSASNYSLAAVSIGTDTTTSATVSGGVGVAFWVSDAGSWWAAVPYYTQTTTSTCTSGACSGTESYTVNCSCTTSTRTCSCTYSYNVIPCSCSTTIVGYTTCTCTNQTVCETNYGLGSAAGGACVGSGGTYSSANGGTCCTVQQTSTCSSGACTGSDPIYSTTSTCPNGACSGTQTVSSQTSTCNSGACSGTEQYISGSTCNSGACSGTETRSRTCSCSSTQAYYLRLLQSVGGTVSTVTSDVSLGSSAVGLKVITAGNTITAQAYSNQSLTTTLGNALTYTASNPTKGASTGLVKTPVGYGQGSIADNFSSGA